MLNLTFSVKCGSVRSVAQVQRTRIPVVRQPSGKKIKFYLPELSKIVFARPFPPQ